MSNKLNIGILTTNPTGQQAEAFKQEIINQGHEPVIISAADAWCLISEANGNDRLYSRSKVDEKSQRIFTKDLDGIIVRLSGSRASYALNVLRHFTNQKIFCTLTDYSIMTSSDKFWLAQIASRIRVKVPRQILSVDAKDHAELIEAIDNKPPVFAKMVHGSEGKGCFVIPDAINGKMFLQSMEAAGQPVILQRHLTKKEEKRREDHRIWTIGAETDNPVFVAMKRISTSRDPRTNWSIHHQAEPYTPTEEEKDICLKISRAIGGGVVACDTMLDTENQQFYLLETNTSPGLGICDIVPKEQNPVMLTVKYVAENCKRSSKNKPFWDNIAINAGDLSFDQSDLVRMINNVSKTTGKTKSDVVKMFDLAVNIFNFMNDVKV